MDEEIVTEYPLFDESWKSFLLTSSTITKNFNDNSSEDQAKAIIWIIILGIIIISIVAAAIYFIFRVVKKKQAISSIIKILVKDLLIFHYLNYKLTKEKFYFIKL
jgi:hypothetical protein